MLWPVLERLNKIGCQRYVVTDVDRGGMLSSPNFDLLQQVCNKTASPIIAGGGVASLDDIKNYRLCVGKVLKESSLVKRFI